VVDDHDLVPNDEKLMFTPGGVDLDQRFRDGHQAHIGGHCLANADVKVDVIHPRYVVAGENGFPDPGALIRTQRDTASLTLSRNAPGLTLLHLALLGLTRLS
jgi:hypothetical protein